MPFIECDGIKIAYDDQGSGEPAFVFVHGWTCDRSHFARQADHFVAKHRVVSVDLRGHGESDKPQGDYSVAAYASDIATLIGVIGLGKVIAVGHSMGGAAVLQLAVDYRESVAAIVMVDPAPLAMSSELRQEFEGLAAAIEAGDEELRRTTAASFFLPTSDATIVAEVTRVVMAAPAHVAAAAMRGIANWDGAAAAAKCDVPALHLSPAEPLNPSHVISQLLPNVVLGQTVGAGHFNQLEVPEQVNLMIEAFLKHYVNQGLAH